MNNEHMRRLQAVWHFAATAVNGDVPAFLENLHALNWLGAFHDVFAEIVPIGWVDPDIQRAFVDAWRGYGDYIIKPPAGIDYAIGRDLERHPDLYVQGSAILAPPYRNTEAPVVLYRGQSLIMHRRGRHGPWWTPYPHVAEWYARSEIRDHTGQRCIIAAFNPRSAIISQLCDAEFLLDPAKLDHIELVMMPPRHTAEQEHQDLGSTTLLVRVPHGYAHEAAREWMAQDVRKKTAASGAR